MSIFFNTESCSAVIMIHFFKTNRLHLSAPSNLWNNFQKYYFPFQISFLILLEFSIFSFQLQLQFLVFRPVFKLQRSWVLTHPLWALMGSVHSWFVPSLSLLSLLLHLHLLAFQKQAEIPTGFVVVFLKLIFYIWVVNRRADNHMWSNYLDYLEFSQFTLLFLPLYFCILSSLFSLKYKNYVFVFVLCFQRIFESF